MKHQGNGYYLYCKACIRAKDKKHYRRAGCYLYDLTNKSELSLCSLYKDSLALQMKLNPNEILNYRFFITKLYASFLPEQGKGPEVLRSTQDSEKLFSFAGKLFLALLGD